MKILDKENLVEVTLDATLSKNTIKDMYEVIEQVASDKFDVCICNHANGVVLQFIGVGDMFSIEYVTKDDNVYKLQDKSKIDDTEEVSIYSEWGGSTFQAHSIVSYDQVKSLFNCFFKTDKFADFKNQVDKLGFTTMEFNPEF